MAKIVMPRTVLTVSAFKAAAPYVAIGVAAHRRRVVGVCRLVASLCLLYVVRVVEEILGLRNWRSLRRTTSAFWMVRVNGKAGHIAA